MLYRPELHEPLADVPWDAERARTAIRTIVADVDRAYDPESFWPAQEWDAYDVTLPLTDLFVGAGGLVWGLDRLRRDGHAETALELNAVARRALARYVADAHALGGHLPTPARSSLFTGEAGLLLVAWLLEPSDELATRLLELVQQNIGNAANELMWGVPGTLLAARVLHARTREERWRAAVEESERALRDERGDDGLWTQRAVRRSRPAISDRSTASSATSPRSGTRKVQPMCSRARRSSRTAA